MRATETEPTDTPGALDRGVRAMLRPAAALALVVAMVYGLSPVVLNGDSYLALPTATSLVHERNLDLEEYQALAPVQRHAANKTLDGKHVNEFPWAPSLFFVPVVLAVDAAHAIGVGPGMDAIIERDQMGAFQLLTASAVTGATAGIVALLAFVWLRSAAHRRRTALLVALAFAFGTAAWSTASRALWQHGPSMLFLSLALLAATFIDERGSGERGSGEPRDGERAARPAFALGACLALAYAMRPTNAIAAVAFGVWMVVRHRQLLLSFAGGAATVVVPWLATNVAAYGHVVPPYNSGSRLAVHDAYVEALLANLVSPARGLLVFSPIVVLGGVGAVIGLRRRRPDTAPAAPNRAALLVLALGVVSTHWLVISAFKDQWWAGHAFGPRFFSDVLPFLVVLALPAVAALDEADSDRADLEPARPPARRRGALAVTAMLVVASVAINAEGAVMRASSCWNVDPSNVQLHPERVWDWSDAQLTRGYRVLIAEGPRAAVAACPMDNARP